MDQSTSRGIGRQKTATVIFNSECPKVVDRFRNKQISKKRYIVEQYFGLSHLHDRAYRARFTKLVKNLWDSMCRQMAFNLSRGSKILATT